MADTLGVLLGVVKAAQVRKSSYVADPGLQYNPDNCHAHTIYAGTVVAQVRISP